MLRAAKQLNFNKDSLTSHNGVLLSPIINLCGLVLCADRPTPKTIYDFLHSKNITVTNEIYNGEAMISLRGYYEIKKEDILNFIFENIILCEAQLEQLDNIPLAVKLKNEISEKVGKADKGEALEGIEQGQPYSLIGGIIFAVEIFRTRSVKDDINNARCASGGDMSITAQRIISTGQKSNTVGFFAERSAKNDLTCNSQSSEHENSIIDSGNILNIEAIASSDYSKEVLAIEPGIKWFNSPSNALCQSSTEALPSSNVSISHI